MISLLFIFFFFRFVHFLLPLFSFTSDSGGGSEVDFASGPLVRQRSVGQQAGAGVDQSTSPRHCSPPNAHAFDRVR